MKLIVFDVLGAMAHFRRFYSNVTSLSYRFPPRNTIAGLLAGIMGRERDSYYELFSRDKCRIGVSIRVPVRRLLFSANYLDTDSLSMRRLRGGGRVPSTIEILAPEPPHKQLNYRIFFSHDDAQLMDAVWGRIKSRRYVYPPALGPAFCIAEIEPVLFAEDVEVTRGAEASVDTVIRTDLLTCGSVVMQSGLKIVLEERLPPDFTSGRTPSGASTSYIFEAEGKPIPIRTDGEVFRVFLQEGDVFGTFM